MIQILKKQGVKAALPLLLLATACGDGGTPSAFSPDQDVISSDGGEPEEIVMSLTEGLDSDFDGGIDVSTAVAVEESVADVPEPATLAGLAIAALGLGAIKRKSA